MRKWVFLLPVFFITTSFAQRNSVKFQTPEAFSIKKQQMFNSPASASLNFMPSYFPAENNNCGFGKGIHYTAFFCKMELRTVDHYNVWIKLHAGDYDRYTKSNLPE